MVMSKAKTGRYINSWRGEAAGLTLIECVVVMALMTLLLSMIAFNASAMIRRAKLTSDISRFARTLRMAAQQAVLSGKDILVVIEVTDGYYTVYQADAPGSLDYDSNDPLIERDSLDYYYIDKIDFDDGSHQYSGKLILRATAKGWGRSFVFNFLDDRDESRRYIRCDRFTWRVVSSQHPLEIIKARSNVSMSSPI
jgi:type II secretory pathway pseudopilin PulG